MTIYVNISNTVETKNRTGIQRVVRQVLSHWALKPDVKFLSWRENSFHLINGQEDIEKALLAEFVPLTETFSVKNIIKGDMFYDIDASWGDNYDLNQLFAKLKQAGVIVVKMHYDAVPLLMPPFSHQDTVFSYGENFISSVDYADYWTCISKTVDRDLMEITQKLGAGKVFSRVINLGADFHETGSANGSSFEHLGKFKNTKFALSVGTMEPRKNHELLLDTFDILWANGEDIELVIVGKAGWNINDILTRIESHEEFRNRLHWLRSASDEEVAELYQHAYVSINLSHYEGYGLPVIESLHFNCVTICTENSALEEVSKGASYAVPLDAEKVVQAIKALENKDIYDNFKQKALEFKAPTWSTAVEELYEALKQFTQEPTIEQTPKQAVYISNRPSNIERSVKSLVEHMNFIEQVVILAPDNDCIAMEQALKPYCVDSLVIAESDLGIEALPEDHQNRNTFLRRKLYTSKQIDSNFIAFDDDYVVLEKCVITDFVVDNCHKGHYFLEDGREWLGAFPQATSFDLGLWRTVKFLHGSGYDTRLYNAHMPQIVNKKIACDVLERTAGLGLDEWSCYFNMAKHLYPNSFKDVRYRNIGWPENFHDWIASFTPENILFENSYDQSEQDVDDRIEAYLQDFRTAHDKRALLSPQSPEVTLSTNGIQFNGEGLKTVADDRIAIKLTTEIEAYRLEIQFVEHVEEYEYKNMPRFIYVPANYFDNQENRIIEIRLFLRYEKTAFKLKIPVEYVRQN